MTQTRSARAINRGSVTYSTNREDEEDIYFNSIVSLTGSETISILYTRNHLKFLTHVECKTSQIDIGNTF